MVELRALGLRGKNSAWEGFAGGKGGIVHGYFDDDDKLASAAAALDKAAARGVYFMINPCIDPLLARASNRLICPQNDAATPDDYIATIRWFLIDLDSKLLDGSDRPSGISATEAELTVCETKAAEVARYLEQEHGFAKAIRAFSGNGYHLNYRLPDLLNNNDHRALIKSAMAALADKFGSFVDVSVVNPARIWKFYGTTGRKGDSTQDRPHRKSYIFPGQPEILADVPVTSLDIFKKFAALASASAPQAPENKPGSTQKAPGSPAPPPYKSRPMAKNELGPIDMEKYLRHYSVNVTVKEKYDKKLGDATFYVLDHCLFNPEHTGGEASIVVPRQGAIKYQCFHSSCKGHTWKDARYKISGDAKLTEFCQGYDPNWTPPQQTGTGMLDDLSVPMLDAISLQNGILSKVPLPKPAEINPKEFYEKKGKRPVFVPWKLALYLSHYLNPICHTAGKFFHYEKGFWKECTSSSLAQICVHALKEEIQAAWIDNVQKILAGMVNREQEEWPKNLELINIRNGMLDVNTRELLPHDPKYGSFQQLPVNYNPDPAKAKWSERWLKFLEEIFPEDKSWNKRNLLQQYFGYCLLRDSRYQRALYLYGTGANGKSTVIDVLTAMVGQENTSSLSLNDLSQKFRASFLEHKLINISAETSRTDPVESSIFKQIVDGSLLMSEQKYGKPYQFRSYAKWVVAFNEPPTISDKSYGLERRVLVLDFNRRFSPHEIKERYQDYLIEEIDEVFQWAVDGLGAILQNGFVVGEDVRKDTSELLDSMNPFRVFIMECCEINDDQTLDYYETTTNLWYAYAEWCAHGHNRPLGRNKFLEQILSTFSRVVRGRRELSDGTSPNVFIGINLTSNGKEYAERGRMRSEKPFKDRY